MPIRAHNDEISIEEQYLTDVDVHKSGDVEKKVYRDPKSAIVFLVNLIATLVFGIMCATTCDWGKISFKDEGITKPEIYEAIGLTIFCLLVAVGLSYVSLWAAAKYTKCLLYTGGVVMIIIIIVLVVLTGSISLLILGLIVVGMFCCMLRQKDSIEFAIWVVQLSCRVLLEHGGMIRLAFLWLLLQVIVCVGFLVLGVAGYIKYGILSVIYLAFTFYWVAEVLSNILVVTVSSLASFWATGGSVWDPQNPVRTSFFVATTYAFGSVCLGSLIVAILKTIRLIARICAGNNSDNAMERCLGCICICILNCLENIIQYFNEWAYAYVAMYRMDFCTSGKMVWDLWKKNGWEVVCNDHFTDMVLFVPPLLTGLVVSGFYVLGAVLIVKWNGNAVLMGALAGFVIGFLMCNMVMRLIGAAQNVIFLSYLEKRDTFKDYHDAEVQSLEDKFQNRYPGVVLCGV